jgi:AcrR family transcriptional regulator
VTGTVRTPRRTRRDEAIAHAADLLREGGPLALTSVAVAERMGVTQSAVYRHVRNMDELSTLAAEVVVGELNQALSDTLFDADMDWEEIDDVGRLCRQLIEVVVRNQRSFEVVARWRFIDGPLGAGIRAVLDDGRDLVAALLESRWRIEFGHEVPLGTHDSDALHAHAQAIHDDGHAVARLAYSPSREPLDLDDIATILQHRIIGGWTAFVIDMNARVGLPFPKIDLETGVVPPETHPDPN